MQGNQPGSRGISTLAGSGTGFLSLRDTDPVGLTQIQWDQMGNMGQSGLSGIQGDPRPLISPLHPHLQSHGVPWSTGIPIPWLPNWDPPLPFCRVGLKNFIS